MVLLGVGAAAALAHGGPADAVSFTQKMEEQRQAVESQAARLEYLLEQQVNAAKANAKGKEEVRSRAWRAPALSLPMKGCQRRMSEACRRPMYCQTLSNCVGPHG